MVKSIVISSNMGIQEAATKIKNLTTHHKLHVKVKTGPDNIQYLHVRALTKPEALLLKLSRDYQAKQKDAAYEVINNISKNTKPDQENVASTFKNMNKLRLLKGAFMYNVTQSKMAQGVLLKPNFKERIEHATFKVQTAIVPLTLSKGLDY